MDGMLGGSAHGRERLLHEAPHRRPGSGAGYEGGRGVGGLGALSPERPAVGSGRGASHLFPGAGSGRGQNLSRGGDGSIAPGVLQRGDVVQVWSNSSRAWYEGTVEEVYQRDCVSEGYQVQAGTVKVISNAGPKYVMPGEVGSTLRWPELTSSGSRPSSAPRRTMVARPKPTGRLEAGVQRLEARDRWNTYEIRLQEIFLKYDKDHSGALEVAEFKDLLRDFNNGKEPSHHEQEFMMRLADKDGDGRINLGELHYALRAWHSYRHLDESVLRLFAEYDFDESGRLDADELQQLLTDMNGGKTVPWEEVRHVIRQGDVLGDGMINRSELLGAVAAWYAHVGRKDTDVTSLVREAVTQAVQEHDHTKALSAGHNHLAQIASLVRSGISGYAQVNSTDDPRHGHRPGSGTWPPHGAPAFGSGSAGPSHSPAATDLESASPTSSTIWGQVGTVLLGCASKFCYIAFPFIFSWILFMVGWQYRFNYCPRNLDGVMMWFGLLLFVFSGLIYMEDVDELVQRARLAIAVILGALNTVGFFWTMDDEVQGQKRMCGVFLVWWSMFVWSILPVLAFAYGVYSLAANIKNLQHKDKTLQHEVVL